MGSASSMSRSGTMAPAAPASRASATNCSSPCR